MGSEIPTTQYGFYYTKKDGLNLKENLPVPKPGPGELLLKVDAVGLCHSDLHIIYEGLDCGDNYVMGHEVAGTVASLGGDNVADVAGYKVGERVACVGPNGCGVCKFCRAGQDNLCTNSFLDWFGLGYDGGYEQYLLVKRPRNLVRIPDNVSSEDAAAITDAMLTPYHALKIAKLTPTSNVLIIGAGGLGINGIQIAKTFGSKITVLDPKEPAREIAKTLGADNVYDKLPDSVKAGSFDICVDFVGAQSTFDLCQKYIRSKGDIVVVGLHSPNLTFNLGDLALREINILGSFWGTSNDLAECFELASQGKVKPKVAKAPLRQLPEYVQKLRKGAYEGRVVFNP
ncbi:uncharacterized protein J8A68_003683 [[Candida] subhashii]|uniref:Enoyl reductase (ER) domain-containing protein n=1 Tax=[Candida] subhashii TaxID=561895 RepID=A0A8J5QLU9_9ASCO|nr:uncharacterized protein J8A68_003683 [[Candida] subhashii]KAG7662828.1 hypothetical protein J8A68_003683 [[Candida] subhashii]